MIDVETVTLITTFTCNAACAHCTVFSGPKRSDTLPDEDARLVIEQAAHDPRIKMIAYTGGEPTLEYDRLLALMAYARSLGLQAGLVSNSSWAVDMDVARVRFAEMIERGLTVYITSLDEYHLEYIELQTIRNALRAALETDVTTHLNLLWTPGYDEAIRKLPATLDLPPEVIDNRRLLVWLNRPSRTRNVRDLVPQGPLPFVDGNVAGPCDHINRHAGVLHWNGAEILDWYLSERGDKS